LGDEIEEEETMEQQPLGTILVPTDLSENSQPAICLALSLAKALGSKVTFLYVWPPEFTFEADMKASQDEHFKHVRDAVLAEHKKALEDFVARYECGGVPVNCVLKSGPPFLEIIMTAKEIEADLILMGTHGRSGLAHVFIGSVAEKVVRRAHCPVMTVKPEGFKFEDICALKE
jgi:nucleotide-binding universal stress UspA family protein